MSGTYPPLTLPAPSLKTLEELLDALGYLLASDQRTSDIQWILGDIGMGAPQETPFAYISQLNESVKWYTANGGLGGLPSAQTSGLDDWMILLVLTVVMAPHQWYQPKAAAPSQGNTFAGQSLQPLPYLEQPGWRAQLILVQNVKDVLRQNIVIGGYAATTNIVESKPILQLINDKLYRAMRITIQAQQRRVRGV